MKPTIRSATPEGVRTRALVRPKAGRNAGAPIRVLSTVLPHAEARPAGWRRPGSPARPCRLPALGAALGLAILLAARAPAQNVVSQSFGDAVAPALTLAPGQIGEAIGRTMAAAGAANPDARCVAAKLDAHVREMIEGWPWLPFHHTLGISGHEAYFRHPDQLFSALALALPCLSAETASRARALLGSELDRCPPYTADSRSLGPGRPRESYTVPPGLRFAGTGQAASAWGVYAFWLWCHNAPDPAAARAHWAAVRQRMQPLLETSYPFDIHRQDSSKNEAEKLNGDLAGMIGLARLAQLNGDRPTETVALSRLARMLELRINLDRVNPHILEKATATKSLHLSKLPRYGNLAPELGEALRLWTDGVAATRLRDFREARNGWHLAFGDRLVGGENYTNPPDFPRSIFAGALWIEHLPGSALLELVDVAWCRADYFFIERCALALWAAGGRPWNVGAP
ncbi:MAG: hypothetical protein KA118_20230 [Verrucomicrobia bacterium]|nr:hypothetical protein [Verrucomicrobiota bacterium]